MIHAADAENDDKLPSLACGWPFLTLLVLLVHLDEELLNCCKVFCESASSLAWGLTSSSTSWGLRFRLGGVATRWETQTLFCIQRYCCMKQVTLSLHPNMKNLRLMLLLLLHPPPVLLPVLPVIQEQQGPLTLTLHQIQDQGCMCVESEPGGLDSDPPLDVVDGHADLQPSDSGDAQRARFWSLEGELRTRVLFTSLVV